MQQLAFGQGCICEGREWAREGGTEGPGGVQLFTSAERKCTRFNPSHPLTIDHHFTVNCVVCPISSLFQVLSVQ